MNFAADAADPLDPRQIAFWKRLTPGQRLDRAMALIRSARRFQTACLRAQHPEWNESQVAAEVRRRWLFSHHANLARRAA